MDGKTEEYNLNVQYALGHDYLLQVGYVGTQSVHRSGQIEFDQALLASPQNPVNGETTNSINNVDCAHAHPGRQSGIALHAIRLHRQLQLAANQHHETDAHGLQFQGSYTWSKNLDEVNGEGGTDIFETAASDQQPARSAAFVLWPGGRRSGPASGRELHLVGAEVCIGPGRCRAMCLPTGSSPASA